MADTQSNTQKGAEQTGSSVGTTHNANGGCARARCGQAGGVGDKDVKVPNEQTQYRENMATPMPGGQQRSEASKAPPSYSMVRWLGEGPKEEYWNTNSCSSLR